MENNWSIKQKFNSWTEIRPHNGFQ